MRKVSVSWLIAGMAASFLVGGWMLPRLHVEWRDEPAWERGIVQAAPSASGADEPIARAVSAVSPAVVNIDTVKRVTVGFFGDPWLDDIAGRRTVRRTGSGSGVLIDKSGHILTNEHVVGGADEINVLLADGRRFRGRVIGADRETDVALIQIRGSNLPVAPIGDSTNLRPGQWAIAIGNPYGFQHTVTQGVISNTGRPVRTPERAYKRLIQTDAAINPGNSGGPLVDGSGRVIGINTMILADAQGIGFAIPIDEARRTADQLLRYGKVKRPWTGLIVAPLRREMAEYLGLSTTRGVIIEQIAPRSPAEAAGLEPGDLIYELGGRRVRSIDDVRAVLSSIKIGQRLPIVVQRGDRLFKGEIEVGEAP
jgi:S1-C subfamily serine protease